MLLTAHVRAASGELVPISTSIEFGNLDANLRFLEDTGVLHPGLKILEIGCGRGTLLHTLRARGFDVVGVETSPMRIGESRRVYGALPIVHISGSKLPFPDTHFDIALSFDVFEHIPDSNAHLAEVSRVLKPGGWYLLQTPNKWTNSLFETIRWRSFSKWKVDHCSLHSHAQLRRRLRALGFKATFDDVKVVTPFFREKVHRYLGRAGLLLLAIVNPDRLPLPLRTNFYVRAQWVDAFPPLVEAKFTWAPVLGRARVAWSIAVAAAVVLGTVVWLATHTTEPPPRVSRLLITPPNAVALTVTANRNVAITHDGTHVVYTGANGTALFVRALDQLDAISLTGLGLPDGPFVSPDGQWIGFADGTTSLKKVAITGGPPVTLARLDGAFRGGTWSPDGSIVFATATPAIGLQRIAAGGGEPTVLTRPNRARGEADHHWPEILPGGQAILFTITATTGGLDQAQVAVLDLRTGTETTLIRGGHDAHYVPSGTSGGHLVYGAAGTLRAVAFDLARLAVVGTPVPVVPQMVTANVGSVDLAVADDGTVVYVPAVGTAGTHGSPVWVDRRGQETPLPAPRGMYGQPRISPDGTRLALHSDNDIWLWDLVRGGLTRLTVDPSNDVYPVWTPDSRQLLFTSDRADAENLFAQPADGTGDVTQLTESPNPQQTSSVSPDGTRLVFTESDAKTSSDVMQLQLDGSHRITPLVQTPFTERNGEVSPDGRWLAYEANDSGSFEIYVRPFPDVTRGRWQVSTGGGTQPLWARNSRELFYFASTGALMRVGVTGGATWAATVPAKLLEGPYYAGPGARMYDIAPDGRLFLMIKPAGGSESTSPPTSLVVVQHFDEDLKRLVPIK